MSQDSHQTEPDRNRTGDDLGDDALPKGYDTHIRACGKRIKDRARNLGLTPLSRLYAELPRTASFDNEEVFQKTLNGRRDSRWSIAFNAIAEIFARKEHALQSSDPQSAAAFLARTSHYKQYIFGSNLSAPQAAQLDDLAPSFERLALPREPSTTADRFLDVMPPTLADMAAGFDAHRAIYHGPNGIRETVTSWLSQAGGPLLVSISGPSGAGKTVTALRLAYDCLERGQPVFRLVPDWACSDSIGVQIRRLLSRDPRPSVFIIDNAGSLPRKGVQPADILRSVADIAPPFVILLAENWRLFAPFELALLGVDASRAKHFRVDALSPRELSDLLDRVIALETSNRVTDVRCHLSKERRLALCSQERDRLAAAALLIFRYGRHLSDILVDEFNGIENDAIKRVYLCLITCAGLGVSVSKSIIRKLAREHGGPGSHFWNGLGQVTAEIDGTLTIRHPLFYRHLSPALIPNADDRADIINSVLTSADPANPLDDHLVLELFSRPKKIPEVLHREKATITAWIPDVLTNCIGAMPSQWQKHAYTCLGQLERNTLADFDEAHRLFQAAISCDRRFGFAYRQRSWNLLHAGKLAEAEKSAREAVKELPDDFKTLSDSAVVLQYCSADGFRFAGEIYAKAIEIDADDTELPRRIERYNEAKNILDYYSAAHTRELPDDVLQLLRAPWFLWKVRKGLNSALHQGAIKGKLGSLLRDPDGDIEEVEDVLRNVGSRRDKILSALIEGNLARIEYQQWYHAGKEIDFDTVERLFQAALEKRPTEAFIRSWYGTFLKEVRKDYSGAEKEYRQALADAAAFPGRDNDYPNRNNPMLHNNLALLLMHTVRMGLKQPTALDEAEQELKIATEEVTSKRSNFLWPFDSIEDLRSLKAEIQANENGQSLTAMT